MNLLFRLHYINFRVKNAEALQSLTLQTLKGRSHIRCAELVETFFLFLLARLVLAQHSAAQDSAAQPSAAYV